MTVQPAEQTSTRLYTVADLEQMPDDGTRRELIEGKLIEMLPGAKPRHSLIATLIAAFLTTYAFQKKSGLVMTELGCMLTRDPDTLLFPDVGYISFTRLGSQNLDEYLSVAPDIAVEVVSPGNISEEIDTKIALYFQYGAQLVWIIHPTPQTARVYHASDKSEGTYQIIVSQGTLDGGNVLPDFSLKLSDLFQNKP